MKCGEHSDMGNGPPTLGTVEQLQQTTRFDANSWTITGEPMFGFGLSSWGGRNRLAPPHGATVIARKLSYPPKFGH